MSSEVTTEFKNTSLRDTVRQSPVDHIEVQLRRTLVAVSIAILVLVLLGLAWIA
jgi:hypothetical protein